jgi:hypothetical protein
MTVTKNLKNNAPAGRKDWIGRAPRWRLNILKEEIEILKEAMTYFLDVKDLWQDPRYIKVFSKIEETASKIETPLMEETIKFPLLEEE